MNDIHRTEVRKNKLDKHGEPRGDIKEGVNGEKGKGGNGEEKIRGGKGNDGEGEIRSNRRERFDLQEVTRGVIKIGKKWW